MNDKKQNQKIYRKGISSVKNLNKEFKSKEKKGCIVQKGTILEAYPNTRFLVELDNSETQINATLAGRLRQNYIKILVGDRVEVELSIFDLNQGRISKRL